MALRDNIIWPHSLRQKGYCIIKKRNFDYPQKAVSIGHLGARDDLTIRISKKIDEMRLLRSLRLQKLKMPNSLGTLI